MSRTLQYSKKYSKVPLLKVYYVNGEPDIIMDIARSMASKIESKGKSKVKVHRWFALAMLTVQGVN